MTKAVLLAGIEPAALEAEALCVCAGEAVTEAVALLVAAVLPEAPSPFCAGCWAWALAVPSSAAGASGAASLELAAFSAAAEVLGVSDAASALCASARSS